jgi:hypothetical protein
VSRSGSLISFVICSVISLQCLYLGVYSLCFSLSRRLFSVLLFISVPLLCASLYLSVSSLCFSLSQRLFSVLLFISVSLLCASLYLGVSSLCFSLSRCIFCLCVCSPSNRVFAPGIEDTFPHDCISVAPVSQQFGCLGILNG